MSTLNEFSNALYLFHENEIDINCTIQQLCTKAKDFFLANYDKVEPKEFLTIKLLKRSTSDFRSRIEHTIDKLNDIIKNESDNDLEAPKKFYEVLFRIDGTPRYGGMTDKINKGGDFYRIRNAKKYVRYDRKGMFAISDKDEKLVGAYRFNPSGYSCLYLASNLYLAWEECRRPDFDTFNFSHFQNTKELTLLDLTIRNRLVSDGHFIMAYLAMLCCAKTTDNDIHNYQYVVPQLLMKALCLSRKKSSKKVIDGIKYISSRRYDQKDFLFKDKNLSFAYVFPQSPHKDTEDLCPKLANMFKLSEPRTYFLYKLHRFNFSPHTAFVSEYQNSLFFQMEQIVKNDKIDRYNK